MPTPRAVRRSRRPRVEALEGRALMATIPVTDLGDAGPGTLRAAVERANRDFAPDVIAFDPGLEGTITLRSAMPFLVTAIEIVGPGADKVSMTILDSNELQPSPEGLLDRHFTVTSDAVVSISGLTLFGGGTDSDLQGISRGGSISNAGTLTLKNMIIRDNVVRGGFGLTAFGGAILNTGSLMMDRCLVLDNVVRGSFAGGIFQNAPGFGGGIFNEGTAIVRDSTIRGNSGTNGGGTFNDEGAALTVINTTFDGNFAVNGGGLGNLGTAAVYGTTFEGNTAAFLGGGANNAGTLAFLNSTLSGNRTTFESQIPFTEMDPGGGGVANRGILSVVGSTIALNLSSFAGAGILSLPGIDGEPASEVTLFGSIVAANFEPDGPSDVFGGLNPFSAFNLIGTDAGLVGVANGVAANRVGTLAAPVDPGLAPLADNGGPTRTHALLPGSPAIDAGFAVPVLATDQRGAARPKGTATDIGAFEAENLPTPAPSVVRLQRFGSSRQLPILIVTFDRDLDPASANLGTSYQLFGPGRDGRLGTGDDRPIGLVLVGYDPVSRTAVLVPLRTLPISGRYRLRFPGLVGLAGSPVTPAEVILDRSAFVGDY